MSEARYSVTTVAKPFTSEGRRKYRFHVDADGTIRVYDSVAGHFTTVHNLSTRDANRVRDRSGWTASQRDRPIGQAYERRYPNQLIGAGAVYLRPEFKKIRRSLGKSPAQLDAEIAAALARSERKHR